MLLGFLVLSVHLTDVVRRLTRALSRGPVLVRPVPLPRTSLRALPADPIFTCRVCQDPSQVPSAAAPCRAPLQSARGGPFLHQSRHCPRPDPHSDRNLSSVPQTQHLCHACLSSLPQPLSPSWSQGRPAGSWGRAAPCSAPPARPSVAPGPRGGKRCPLCSGDSSLRAPEPNSSGFLQQTHTRWWGQPLGEASPHGLWITASLPSLCPPWLSPTTWTSAAHLRLRCPGGRCSGGPAAQGRDTRLSPGP